MTRKKKVNDDGPQTLKQAKAAFKARGSTAVSSTEKRQLERGAVLLERATRIKEQEQRRKDILKKKAEKDAKALQGNVPCLLGTQRRLDRFGHKSSQFHLGAFLRPKPTTLQANQQTQVCSQEPWEDDDVDDDTLLDLAAESPVATAKKPAERVQPTPSKCHPFKKPVSPMVVEDMSSWASFLERSSQLARELAHDQGNAAPSNQSFSRISSFDSGDFDLSAEDLEELDVHGALASKSKPCDLGTKTSRRLLSGQDLDNDKEQKKEHVASKEQKKGHITSQEAEKMRGSGETLSVQESLCLVAPNTRPSTDMCARMLPPKVPEKHHTLQQPDRRDLFCPPLHGVSLADLESLAGEEIQLSQFDGI